MHREFEAQRLDSKRLYVESDLALSFTIATLLRGVGRWMLGVPAVEDFNPFAGDLTAEQASERETLMSMLERLLRTVEEK